MEQPYTSDDDARVAPGQERAHRRGSASPTAAELAAEDARARELIGNQRKYLPPTWYEDSEDDE